jgi:YegS/Rv2252/BmrU family lipid kinase
MAKKRVRALIVYNPRSGKGDVDISPALEVFDEQGWELTIRQKQHEGDGTRLARKAAKHGYDVVLASGGDGTVNEVVAGLIGTDVAMGVLPIGTLNEWAGEMGFAHRLDVVARQLLLAERHRVDVGRLMVNGEHAAHFLLLAGLGADAVVVELTSRALKNRIGVLAVGLAMLEALPAMEAMSVEAELDGVPWRGQTHQIIVGNSRRYGGLTSVTGGAYIDDGMLDVCFFTIATPLQLARQVGSLLLLQRPDLATAEVHRASTVVIRTPRCMPVEIDGSSVDTHLHDGSGGREYRLTVEPGALCALVPRTYDGHLFRPTALATTFALEDLAPRHASGEQRHNGHDGCNGDTHRGTHRGGGHHAGHRGHRMRVLGVGVDSILAEKLRSGRRVTLHIGPQTRVEGDSGTHAALDGLAEGDIVEVEGKKEKSGTIAATRITRLADPTREAVL